MQELDRRSCGAAEGPVPPQAICAWATGAGKSDVRWPSSRILPLEIVRCRLGRYIAALDIADGEPAASDSCVRITSSILDPRKSYSARPFVRDALAAMDEIEAEVECPLWSAGHAVLPCATSWHGDLPPATED